MDFIVKNNINLTEFAVFIRDLSENVNANIKHIIQDNINEKNIEKKKIKKENKKNKKKGLTAEMIIQKNIEKKNLEKYESDRNKTDYFMKKVIDTNIDNLYNNIQKLETDKGIIYYKYKVLHHLWKGKNKNMENILGLYFNLINHKTNDIKNQELLSIINKKLGKYDIISYMLSNLGHILPPLNIWDKKKLKLEEWQLETLKYIEQNKSIIVSAPTSSGKSFCGLSAGVFHNKILYVCPVEPVVYQVGSQFIKMGYNVHYIIDNFEYISYTDKTNIFIGTPKYIEDFLYKYGCKFDYAVYDEIHNLNKKDDGNIYENIIKLIDCNFLALSATIKDIDKLKNIFETITKKNIKTITYTKRFINQQRWIWNKNKLEELHPLSCIDNVNDIVKYNLPFSPKDIYNLWEEIHKEFDEYTDKMEDEDESEKLYDYIMELSPEHYFNYNTNKLISLDDAKNYELFLKENLIILNNKYPNIVTNIIKKFKKEFNNLENTNKNIIKLLIDVKNKDMLPMLIFNTEKENCINIFKYIDNELRNEELNNYPYHYDILEKKNELYKNYIEKRNIFNSKIKISKSSKDALTDIQNKMNKFDETEKYKYIDEISKYYNILLEKVQNNELQYKNLFNEYKKFMETPDFCYQNIFKKHENYCFTKKEPMTDEAIKNIRKKLFKSINIKLDYENSIIQLLKRGIGIYIEGMPNEYNWVVQQLLANKEIGIVICDKILCLGIDLPIRTSCIADFGENTNFTQDDYLQMSGRAGRRGHDSKGNIIFWNINFNNLMKSELPNINGSNIDINTSYKIKNIKLNTDKLFTNFINNQRKISNQENIIINEKWSDLLQWKLRIYNNGNKLINNLDNIESKIFNENIEFNKELIIINYINNTIINNNELVNIYKNNKLTNKKDIDYLIILYNIIIILHNNVHNNKFMLLKKECKKIFTKIKNILINNSGINNF